MYRNLSVVTHQRTLAALFLAAAIAIPVGAQPSSMVDRVDTTAFIQVEADSFNALTPKQQALAYWLSQAAIAIDPIIYDQLSRFGLREKAILEAVVTKKGKVDPAAYAKILEYTKLFWANRGNHNENTSQKFLPAFTPEELKRALVGASRSDLLRDAAALKQAFFDPNFEPMITAKSPQNGLDIIQASANNYYLGVTLADLKGFTEKHPLNSRVAKEKGKLVEQVYRTGTPDGKIAPGLYAQYLKKANGYLAKARAYAEPDQAKVIDNLIRFYQTGDYSDWLQFGRAWVVNNPPVDFVNGFIEVYRDARGAKGSSQSFVSVTDEKLSGAMKKIAANAQYFEDKAPWLSQYKKQGVTPPVAKAIETVVETGDFHITTIGDNLPNEDEIREKEGSKSFLFSSSTRALDTAVGDQVIDEFGYSPEEVTRYKKYNTIAGDLLTSMHEVIGHGSGKLNPKLTQPPQTYLKEYYSALEEARADLMAYWNVFDPKLKELGLVSSDEVGKAMYDNIARNMIYQLRRIPSGDTIEEDHQRGRQLTAEYIMDKTGAIAIEKRNGKTYAVVKDYQKMHQGIGQLLAELMRIKAEGDYAAIKALMDKYGVHFDPKLRDEVVARYKSLDLPTYFAGINADLTAQFDAKGNVTKVTMSYPRDFVKQQLDYSAMYPPARRR
jgi:dipeptidyl-peptidase-3